MLGELIQQLASQLVLKISNSTVYLLYVVVDTILKLNWDLPIIRLHHPVKNCQFCVQNIVFLPKLSNQVTNLWNVVAKQDAAEHLQKSCDDHFILAVW